MIDGKKRTSSDRPDRTSRRGILRTAFAAAGVAAAGSAVRALTSGDAQAGANPLLLGVANTAAATTSLNASFPGAALVVRNKKSPSIESAPGAAIAAYVGPKAPTGSESTAVYASNSAAPLGNQATYGVQGRAVGSASTGVRGFSQGGVGVMGSVNSQSASSAGVWGNNAGKLGTAGKFTAAPGSRALETVGRLALSQGGVAEARAGVDSVLIEDVDVGAASLALVTLQGQPKGIHVVSAVIQRKERVGTLEIHFSAKVPAGGVTVGYLIVDAHRVR